jgi:hypothetical protein
VSRLKELVQYLLDLSLTKSDAVLAKATLFDPRAFCLSWAEGRFGDSACGLKIECVEPPAIYPALYGDRTRLARILSILAQLLVETYQTDTLRLSLSPLIRECTMRLSLPPGPPPRGATPGVFQHEKDIRLELARQLSVLHGGYIRFVEDREGRSAVLSLPYPTLQGSIRAVPDDSTRVLCIGPERTMRSASPLSAEEPMRRLPYNAVFNQDISEAERVLVYLDPLDIDHETSAALSFILDQDIAQRAEVYIALHAGMGEAVLERAADAAEFLRSTLFSETSSILDRKSVV